MSFLASLNYLQNFYPMENLKSLIENNEHEKILQLKSPEYDRYKAIAAIQLEKYEEALLYTQKLSFECAYVYYKLKNFKKSLKILRKLSGKDVDILKSQCLYFLGYYVDAYKILSQFETKNEFAVNLLAMESLASINNKNRTKPSLFTSKDSKILQKAVDLKFTDPECRLEGEFNESFKFVENEREWTQILINLQNKYKIENSYFEKQLKNISGGINDSLSKREEEINQFNCGVTRKIKNPVLFQENFVENANKTDFQIFSDFQANKEQYLSGSLSFEAFNSKLRLLKAFIIAKRKSTEKRSECILKTLENVEDSIEKRILTLLGSNLPEKEFQTQALKLILEESENK